MIDVLDVPCPVCLAHEGERCRPSFMNGWSYEFEAVLPFPTGPHVSRKLALKRAREEAP